MATNPLQSLPAPALVFAGQASRWQESLIEAASNPDVALELTTLLAAARKRTAPVGREIAIAAPGAGERLDELLAGGDAPASRPGDVRPAVSVPGIVLGQIAAHRELRELGLDLDGSTPLVGYSQGALGVLAASEPLEALSLAITLGAALSATTAGGTDRRPRMLAVGGATREFIEANRGDAALAVANGRRQATLSGSPEQLADAQSRLETAAKEHNDALEERLIGGSAIELAIDPLPVAGAFHHPDSAAAAELTREWFASAGFDAGARSALVEEILVEPEDWPAKVRSLIESGAPARWRRSPTRSSRAPAPASSTPPPPRSATGSPPRGRASPRRRRGSASRPASRPCRVGGACCTPSSRRPPGSPRSCSRA